MDFVKGQQLLFDQVLREDVSGADELTMEQLNLVVGILSKVWSPLDVSSSWLYVNVEQAGLSIVGFQLTLQ